MKRLILIAAALLSILILGISGPASAHVSAELRIQATPS